MMAFCPTASGFVLNRRSGTAQARYSFAVTRVSFLSNRFGHSSEAGPKLGRPLMYPSRVIFEGAVLVGFGSDPSYSPKFGKL